VDVVIATLINRTK